MSLKQTNKARVGNAATLVLFSVIVQLLGAAAIQMAALHPYASIVTNVVTVAFYAVTAWGMYCAAPCSLLFRIPFAVALLGAAVTCIQPFILVPPASRSIIISVLLLALYLPMQFAFDSQCALETTSNTTRTLGKKWFRTLVAGRVITIFAQLPLFNGSPSAIDAQGTYSTLIRLQIALELIALIAVFLSYCYQIRYLWRIRGIFSE